METPLGLCEQCSADVLAKLRLNLFTRFSCESHEETGHKRLLGAVKVVEEQVPSGIVLGRFTNQSFS